MPTPTDDSNFSDTLKKQLAPPPVAPLADKLPTETKVETPAPKVETPAPAPTPEAKPAASNPPPIEDKLPTLEALAKKAPTKATPTKEENLKNLRELREAAEKEKQELAQKLKQVEEELAKVAFERSPVFKQKFVAPKEQAEANLRSFVESMGVEKDEADDFMRRVISGNQKERITMIDTLFSGTAAAEAFRLAREVDLQNSKLQEAIADHRKTQEELTVAELKNEEKQQEEILEAFSRTQKQLSDSLSYFKEIDGDVEHNASVAQRVEAAKAIALGQASDSDLAMTPFLAVICGDVIQRNNELAAELAKYKARANEESKAREVGGRGTDTPARTGKPQSTNDLLKSLLAK